MVCWHPGSYIPWMSRHDYNATGREQVRQQAKQESFVFQLQRFSIAVCIIAFASCGVAEILATHGSFWPQFSSVPLFRSKTTENIPKGFSNLCWVVKAQNAGGRTDWYKLPRPFYISVLLPVGHNHCKVTKPFRHGNLSKYVQEELGPIM